MRVALPQLHYHPGNANLAPHMVLEEIGAPFELVLYESAAICRYLADKHPEARLAPLLASPPARSLPHVGPYLQRMLARPAVQRAFAAEQIAQPLV